MESTNTEAPEYFHKVVDCQWACPAHTPVPEYIRLIAQGRYADAYMVNWKSNVFPGILGRTCDRPCEPACRRGRIEDEPVAICRLKRVAADNKGDVSARMPTAPVNRIGKKVACIGAGPASMTVARDLAPLGYHVVVYDADAKAGGMIRSQIPRFRLPESVIDEEMGYITDLGLEMRLASASTAWGPFSRKTTTPSSSARERRADATWTCPVDRRPPATSISASTGSPASRSATSRRSVAG